MMRWLWVLPIFFVVAWSWCVEEPPIQVPSPEKRLSMDDARKIHQSFVLFVSRHPRGVPLPLPAVYIRCFERILLDFPDERFLLTRGLGLPEMVERGCVRYWLAASYRAERKWYEALTLELQNLLMDWVENIEKKMRNFHPFPDPFRSDPPAAILNFAKHVREMQEKGVRLSPLIFVRGWCLRARWKSDDPKDALVSLNDFAYALGYDQQREIIQRDWKEWRFTLFVKGKTVSFTAGSRKANVDGKEVLLTHQTERSFYDLYVPLGDLVKVLGGTIRTPKADELAVFQQHLPIPLLVVDLD